MTALADKNKELEAAGRLEDKTKLLKGTIFAEEVQEAISGRNRPSDKDRKHVLVLLDIDNFKAINTLFENNWDQTDTNCLLPFAELIKTAAARRGSLAGRLSSAGDEFGIFLSDTDLPKAQAIIELLLSKANAEIKFPGSIEGRDFLGSSIGLVEFPQGSDFKTVFGEAAELANMAKTGGKNQIQAGYSAEYARFTDV